MFRTSAHILNRENSVLGKHVKVAKILVYSSQPQPMSTKWPVAKKDSYERCSSNKSILPNVGNC